MMRATSSAQTARRCRVRASDAVADVVLEIEVGVPRSSRDGSSPKGNFDDAAAGRRGKQMKAGCRGWHRGARTELHLWRGRFAE